MSNPTSKDPYKVMMSTIMERCLIHFGSKASDYGPAAFQDLGVRGQFSDMWRKMQKLKRALWDGYELKHEKPDEILLDMFGHILITLYLLDQQTSPSDLPKDMRPRTPDLVTARDVLWDDTGRCETHHATDGKRCRRHKHPTSVEHVY